MKYILSDIHGCFHTLTALLDKIYAVDSEPQLIFVGDYIDRGLHCKETIDLMINLQSKGAICLRGNHDDAVDFIVNGECKSNLRDLVWGEPTRQKVLEWMLVNGIGTTLGSYGTDLKGTTEEILVSFINSVPESHKQFLRSLPLFWENETHFACHGYFRPREELPRDLKFVPNDRSTEILWSRFEGTKRGLSQKSTKWDKIGVFGHTPVSSYGSPVPIKMDKIRLIDTGSFFSDGYICAFDIQQDDWILQATDSRDLPKDNVF